MDQGSRLPERTRRELAEGRNMKNTWMQILWKSKTSRLTLARLKRTVIFSRHFSDFPVGIK